MPPALMPASAPMTRLVVCGSGVFMKAQAKKPHSAPSASATSDSKRAWRTTASAGAPALGRARHSIRPSTHTKPAAPAQAITWGLPARRRCMPANSTVTTMAASMPIGMLRSTRASCAGR